MECYIVRGAFTLLVGLFLYASYKLGKCLLRDLMAYIIKRVRNIVKEGEKNDLKGEK